jgi:hypothetical protein
MTCTGGTNVESLSSCAAAADEAAPRASASETRANLLMVFLLGVGRAAAVLVAGDLARGF